MAVRGKAQEHTHRDVHEIATEHAEGALQGADGHGEEGPRILPDLSAIANGSESVSEAVRKGRSDDEKRSSFTRLASLRTSNALDAMRGIAHLSNATSYAFDADQVDRMLGALEASLSDLRKNFSAALAPKPAKVEGQKRPRGERNLSFRL